MIEGLIIVGGILFCILVYKENRWKNHYYPKIKRLYSENCKLQSELFKLSQN